MTTSPRRRKAEHPALDKIAEFLRTNVHPMPYSHDFALHRAQEILDMVLSDSQPDPPKIYPRMNYKNKRKVHYDPGTNSFWVQEPDPTSQNIHEPEWLPPRSADQSRTEDYEAVRFYKATMAEKYLFTPADTHSQTDTPPSTDTFFKLNSYRPDSNTTIQMAMSFSPPHRIHVRHRDPRSSPSWGDWIPTNFFGDPSK